MTENKSEQQPGAPLAEEQPDAAEVAAAVARAQEEIPGADPLTAAAPAAVADETSEAAAAEPVAAGYTQPALPEFLDTATQPYSAAEAAEATTPAVTAVATGTPTGAAAPEFEAVSGAAAQPAAATAQVLPEQLPSAAAEPVFAAGHPMAALYSEAPLAPEKQGNRVAGLFISLLATLVFAAVYAGVILLFLAPHHSIATIFDAGLVPYLLSPGYWGAALGFFFAMLVIVMIFGRAGWWAYVLSSFLVGVAVWAASAVGYSFSPHLISSDISQRALLRLDPDALAELLKLSQNWIILLAGIIGREVAVWFGAWIGARGKRVTAKNKEAQEEYEEAVAALGAAV